MARTQSSSCKYMLRMHTLNIHVSLLDADCGSRVLAGVAQSRTRLRDSFFLAGIKHILSRLVGPFAEQMGAKICVCGKSDDRSWLSRNRKERLSQSVQELDPDCMRIHSLEGICQWQCILDVSPNLLRILPGSTPKRRNMPNVGLTACRWPELS